MKNLILGNVQLIEYCHNNDVDISMLKNCNIERMGDLFLFVLPQKDLEPIMDNDIATQPKIILAMDASLEKIQFKREIK